MTHTVDTLMALADGYANSYMTFHEKGMREALLTALMEALESKGCISNCDTCTYAHGSPAHAGYCYMFYEEPKGVCGQWKDYAGLQAAQPVRESFNDADANLWLNKNKLDLHNVLSQPVRGPIEYLLNGARVKLNFNKAGNMTSLSNMQHELQGRWVAFVAAEDGKHIVTHGIGSDK